jgi:predicted metal-dependent enzyme (double-stranded beta helix superfamily)
MRALTFGLVATGWLSIGILAQTYPPPFPRTGATKLLENERVVVWDVTWPKGVSTGMHRHPYDLTGVYLAPGDRIITAVDGTKRPVSTAAGGIVWQRRGLTHIEEGSSDPPLHAIMIELKEDGPVGTDSSGDLPPAFPRETAKLLLENERIRVWDNVWPVGSTGPVHRHVRDNVVVWMADGKLRSTPRDGAPTVTEVKRLTATYSKRGNVHSEQALEGPPRAYVFELK